jgi:cell division protein FtsW
VGARINGAQRWFRYGGLSVQPSELAKITLPLFVCAMLERQRIVLDRWIAGTVPVLLPIVLVVPLTLLQPDLGTSVFLAVGAAIALCIGGWPVRYFACAGLLVIPAAGYLVALKPYQMARVTGFITAWVDWTSAPYQLKQSLVTLGAGGLWGEGLGRGFQKLSFLPESNTDFVFAVIGEELGLLGTLAVIALWAGMYLCGLKSIGRLPRPSFEYAAAFTLLTQLLLQVALNIAVVTAMVPPKGIPHPLISYGGSNLVVSLVAIGIVLSLTHESANKQT